MRRIRHAVGVLAASALLSACGLLGFLYPPIGFPDSSLYPPIYPDLSFDPFSSELPMGTLRHGKATIKITSGDPQTIELTHLSGSEPSEVMRGLGAFVTWRTGDWGLLIAGGSGSAAFGSQLMITREDTDPPLEADGSACRLTFTAQTATHVAGHAECKGLVWRDPFGPDGMDLPRPSTSASPGVARPPFDATVTFDATP